MGEFLKKGMGGPDYQQPYGQVGNNNPFAGDKPPNPVGNHNPAKDFSPFSEIPKFSFQRPSDGVDGSPGTAKSIIRVVGEAPRGRGDHTVQGFPVDRTVRAAAATPSGDGPADAARPPAPSDAEVARRTDSGGGTPDSGRKSLFVAGKEGVEEIKKPKDLELVGEVGRGKTGAPGAESVWGEKPVWDPNSRTLTVEGGMRLNPTVKNFEVTLPRGKIEIKGTEGKPAFSTTLTITADSEEAARKALEEKTREEAAVREAGSQTGLAVNTGNEYFVVDGTAEGLSGGSGNTGVVIGDGVTQINDFSGESYSTRVIGARGVVIDGNVGSIHMSGGKVWIDGKLVEKGGRAPISMHREDALELPPSGSFQVKSTTGAIDVTRVKGQGEITSRQGDVFVFDYTGKLKADVGSGNLTVGQFDGTLHATTKSGNVLVRGADFNGESRIHTNSGNVTVREIRNDSLGVHASTNAGVVTPPNPSENFTTTERSSHYPPSVKGYFGNDPNPQDTLRIDPRIGDVSFSKSE